MFFGAKHALFGIVSESERASPQTGIVLLNSGLVYRAGPFRLGVEMSRSLAAAGFPVLRIDQSARGDSMRRPGIAVAEAAELDIEEAKETLRSHCGVNRIVLAGLCSGADDAVRHASQSEDIHGLILMDPYAPKTNKYFIRHHSPRLLHPKKVLRSVGRALNVAMANVRRRTRENTDLGAIREFPSETQAREAFRRISERGGASLCAFTSAASGYYNYEGQLTGGLQLDELAHSVEEILFQTSEHTYPIEAHRLCLIITVVDFCKRRMD